MKHTISVLVENHAGVLSRVSGLFSRRGFNIDSLAVGETDNPEFSRITIVADGDDNTARQIEKQLSKLIDVKKVKELLPDEFISRELQLIKINASPEQRSDIVTVCNITGAKIIDITSETLTLEISDTTAEIARFYELIKPYGVKEIVRTGVVALQKGFESF